MPPEHREKTPQFVTRSPATAKSAAFSGLIETMPTQPHSTGTGTGRSALPPLFARPQRSPHVVSPPGEQSPRLRPVLPQQIPQPVPISPHLGEQKPILGSGSRARAKRIACVECRQQKSKCNAQENAPNPCTRCATRGLVCSLRPDYKRTYKRARNAQLEHAYNDLRGTLNGLLKNVNDEDSEGISTDLIQRLKNVVETANALNNSSNAADTASRNGSGNGNVSLSEIGPGNQNTETQETEKDSVAEAVAALETIECESKSYESFELPADKIKELFLEYAQHYHPILPIVDISNGPEKIYRLCPALFWVIMLTALRRSSDKSDSQMLMQLMPLVKNILEQLTITPITRYSPSEFDEPTYNASSVYSVQAFLIFTMWPPLASSLSADSSWNTTGIAVYQAIRIGLHSPGHASDFSNAAKTENQRQIMLITEQLRTWISCNIVSQTTSTVFGYPSFTSLDTNVVKLMDSQELKIPKEISQLMEIADFEGQIVSILNANDDSTDKKPLIDILDQRLDKIYLKLNYDNLDDYRKFALLCAKMHLYTYYFLAMKSLNGTKFGDSLEVAQKQGLIKLFNSCTNLISHCQNAQLQNKKFMKYLPGVYVISIWQASFMITKIAFSPLKNIVDFQRGKTMYQVAIYLTLRNSVMKHDISYRFAGIMQSLWQLFDTLNAKKSLKFDVNITSRMAASVFFDCLFILREKSGMIKYMIKKNGTGEDADDSDDSDVEGLDTNRQQDAPTGLGIAIGNGANSANTGGDDYGVISGDEYPDSDNSASLDEKIKDLGSTPSNSETQENSKVDSQSNGSHPSKNSRTLEDVLTRPENSARKIIKTIPLDPQPKTHRKRKSSFDLNNKRRRSFGPSDQNDQRPVKKPNTKQKQPQHPVLLRNQEHGHTSAELAPVRNVQNQQGLTQSNHLLDMSVSPVNQKLSLENPWLNSQDLQNEFWNSDLDNLLKDVSSVMNDFGFHDIYKDPVADVSLFQHQKK